MDTIREIPPPVQTGKVRPVSAGRKRHCAISRGLPAPHQAGRWESAGQDALYAIAAHDAPDPDRRRAHPLSKKRDHGNQGEWNDQIIVGDRGDQATDFFALNDALGQLEQRNAKLAQLPELKYFGDLQLDELAEIRGTSPATVNRELTLGRRGFVPC